MKNEIDISPNWKYAATVYMWAINSNRASTPEWVNAADELLRMGVPLAQIAMLKSKKLNERKFAESKILELADKVDLNNESVSNS